MSLSLSLKLLKRRLRRIDGEIEEYSWWPTYVTDLQFERHEVERKMKELEQKKETADIT